MSDLSENRIPSEKPDFQPGDPSKPKPSGDELQLRANVIADAKKFLSPKFVKTDGAPDMLAMQELKGKRDMAVKACQVHMDPIIQYALEIGPGSPLYAHTDTGKANLIMTAQKFFTGELSNQFSHDDLIYLLSFEYAFRVVEQRV